MGFMNSLQRTLLEEHRSRIFRARSTIANIPPNLHLNCFLLLGKLSDDTKQYGCIMAQSLQLLVDMHAISCTHGEVRTFEHCKHCENPRVNRFYNSALFKQTEQQNKALGQRLMRAKSAVQTQHTQKEFKLVRSKSEHFRLPTLILKKYENLCLSRNLLRQLLRPKIFFELSYAGSHALGRIVIQLFTEACPQVVLEFVRFCKTQNSTRVRFVHLFPRLWLEGMLQLENEKLNLLKIEYDKRALDHGLSAGVLSFPEHNIKGFTNGCINFAISFRPLAVLNGNRVGFGRVLQGMKLLSSIQNGGTKKGKMLRKIILSNCGML